METFEVTLLPGVPWRFGDGRFFMVVRSAPSDLEIKFNRSGSPRVARNMGAGFKLGPLAPSERWENGYLLSTTGGAVTYVMADDVFDFDPPENVTIASPATFTAGRVALTGAADLVAAANTARKSILVKADPGNAGPVDVGGAGVVAGAGFELLPGEGASIDTQAAVYVIGTAADNVQFIEEG